MGGIAAVARDGGRVPASALEDWKAGSALGPLCAAQVGGLNPWGRRQAPAPREELPARALADCRSPRIHSEDVKGYFKKNLSPQSWQIH